jgi:hypothetical protein
MKQYDRCGYDKHGKNDQNKNCAKHQI